MEDIIAVDTNIIVRLITKDDQSQYQQSLLLFQQKTIFIPNTVILETEWVLRFAYKFRPSDIDQAFKQLFGLPNVILSSEISVLQAIEWHEQGIDFADALHLATSQHCSALYTFDEKYIKKAKALTNTQVLNPRSLGKA